MQLLRDSPDPDHGGFSRGYQYLSLRVYADLAKTPTLDFLKYVIDECRLWRFICGIPYDIEELISLLSFYEQLAGTSVRRMNGKQWIQLMFMMNKEDMGGFEVRSTKHVKECCQFLVPCRCCSKSRATNVVKVHFEMKFDELLFANLGEFGRYQKIQFTLVCLPIMFVSMHALSWTFSAASVPHRCRLPDEDLNANYWTENDLLATVGNCTEKKRCRYQECQLRNGSTCRFGYVYDLSEIKYSAINRYFNAMGTSYEDLQRKLYEQMFGEHQLLSTRWQIVCEWSVLKAFIQSTYYIGQMGGSLLFGFLGDRIGRKKVFFISIIMLIVSGVLMAVAPYWPAFALLRAAVGFAHPGIFVIAVVIGMELVGPSKRKVASVISGVFFSFGQIFLGCLAYFIRDYRYLQLAISLPALIFMCYWWFVPESARWLVAQRKYEEADKILQRAAKINGVQLPQKWWDQIDLPEKTARNRFSQRKYNYFDLIRTPRIRLRTFACLFLWPVVSMIYYGVSMKTDFLGGDFYGTFIAGGMAEIPALLLLFVLIDRIGRKPLFAGGYFVAALCMLSNLLLPPEVHWIISVLQFLVAKAAITSCYALIYTVTPELYPTVIRNSAMGCCSMFARVGANLSCYIVMWIVEQFGTWAMIIPFGGLSLMAGLTVIFCIPETMGKPLPETVEEIEDSCIRSTNEELLTLSDISKKNSDSD
uniref:Major facilitator superfamily (MFS) profile domain-containing protein n=1 Tax=Setaria digitata TaxID=48799 RepID=A0A915PIM3_9BILA